MGDAARAPVSVDFQTEGVDTVRRGIALVRNDIGDLEGNGEAMGEKFAMATRHMAMGLEEVAHTGEVAGRGMKEIIATGAEMAFSFGAGGPVAAAVGILGLIFVDKFTKAREEIEKTEQQFEDSLKNMINAGNTAAMMQQAQNLYRGTPFGNFEDGIVGVTAEVQRLQRDLDEAKARTASLAGKPGGAQAVASILQPKIDALDAAQDKLKGLTDQFDQLQKAILDVNNTPLKLRGLPTVKVTADSPDKQPAEAVGLPDNFAEQLRKGLPAVQVIGEASRTSIQALRALLDELAFARARAVDPKDQVDLDRKIADTQKQLEQLTTPQTVASPKHLESLVKAGAAAVASAKDPLVQQQVTLWEQVAEQSGKAFTDAMRRSFTSGIETLARTGNIGAGFKQMLGGVLAGLGAMAEEIGTAALPLLQLQATIKHAIESFLPEVGIPAAIGLIALGATLQAGGASLSAGGGGSGGAGAGGYGGGYNGLPAVITNGYVTPSAAARGSRVMPASPVYAPILAINPNDLASQRLAQELVRNGNKRGGVG